MSGRYLDLQLNPVRVKPPVSHMAAALIQTFRGLNSPFGTFCTTDHDALLKTPVVMTIDAERLLKTLTRYRLMGSIPVATGSYHPIAASELD